MTDATDPAPIVIESGSIGRVCVSISVDGSSTPGGATVIIDPKDPNSSGETGGDQGQGPAGAPGIPGPTGPAGPSGVNGKSAYELWEEQGFIGSIQDYYESLTQLGLISARDLAGALQAVQAALDGKQDAGDTFSPTSPADTLTVTPAGGTARSLGPIVLPANHVRAAAYGVVGDGQTPDSANLLKATNAAAVNGSGGALVLDSAAGYRMSAAIALPNSAQWHGGGGTMGLFSAVSSGPTLKVIGNYGGVFNLPMSYVGPSGQPCVGVQVGDGEQGSSPVLRDMRINGFDTGIDVRSNVSGKIENVTVDHFGVPTLGIRFRNITNSDAGDWTMTGVTVSHPNGQGRLISYESGGGLKVLGYKGLGGTIGFDLTLPDGTATQDLQFTGSSIENCTVACMRFGRVAGGTTGVFGNITVVGSEFAGSPYGLWFIGAGITNAAIVGNTFSSISGVAIRLDPGANNIVIAGNASTGAILVQDNRTAFTDEYGYINRDDTVAMHSNSDGDYSYTYHLTLPPNRGCWVRLVMEGFVNDAGYFVRVEEFMLANPGSGPLAVSSIRSSAMGVPIDFVIGTNTPGVADLAFRLGGSGSLLRGTATIEVNGKTVSVSR